MNNLRITKTIQLRRLPWDDIAELHSSRTDIPLNKATFELRSFREALEVLPTVQHRAHKYHKIITSLGAFYGVDTLKLSFTLLPLKSFSIRKIWSLNPWTNPHQISEEVIVSNRVFKSRTSLALIWSSMFLASAAFSAALVGLTLYGLSMIVLLCIEPELTIKAFLRDFRLWSALLCFLTVWAGLSGRALANVFKRVTQ